MSRGLYRTWIRVLGSHYKAVYIWQVQKTCEFLRVSHKQILVCERQLQFRKVESLRLYEGRKIQQLNGVQQSGINQL